MLTREQVLSLMGGQGLFAELAPRNGGTGRIVQIVPIRGRKTGRVVRFSVTIRKRGQGTVAR